MIQFIHLPLKAICKYFCIFNAIFYFKAFISMRKIHTQWEMEHSDTAIRSAASTLKDKGI